MEEIWKDIDGFEGLYQISSLGRIKSLAREVPFGGKYRKVEEVVLKRHFSRTGYEKAALGYGGKKIHTSVHRLVAKHFIPNPDNKPQVNHKNGIKSDNRVENLEWVTNSENIKHSFTDLKRKPFFLYGTQKHNCKLTEQDVIEIKKALQNPICKRDLARKYNVHETTIANINSGRKWKHIKI